MPEASFIPATEHYGKRAYVRDGNGRNIARGMLTDILSPFSFVVDGIVWEVGQTDDFDPSADKVEIYNAVRV